MSSAVRRKRFWEVSAAVLLLITLAVAVGAVWSWRQYQHRLDTSFSSALDKAYTSETPNLDAVRRLLKRGADPRVQSERTGITLLPLACAYGDPELVGVSLRAGADVNARDAWGSHPILNAATAGVEETVSLLIGSHANLEQRDFLRRTPLILAAGAGHAEVVRVLIAAGAKVGAMDQGGCNAMMAAVQGRHPDLVRALLTAGVPVNAVDKDGRSALMYAVNQDDAAIVRLLLAAGANARIKARWIDGAELGQSSGGLCQGRP